MTEEQRAARQAKALASRAKFDAAVAAMRPLPAAEMSEDGCIALVTAFWKQVRADLAAGSPAARRWVEAAGPTFVRWCGMCRADPDAVRDYLLAEVWENRAHLPRLPAA